MIVYVAGRTSDYQFVREVQQALIEAGHVISYDWTRAAPDSVWEKEHAMGDIETYDDEHLRDQAEKDLIGATAADVLVLCANEKMVGSYIEVGAALAVGNPVYILGEPERESVFYKLSQIKRFESVGDLVDQLSADDEGMREAFEAIDSMIADKARQEPEWRV